MRACVWSRVNIFTGSILVPRLKLLLQLCLLHLYSYHSNGRGWFVVTSFDLLWRHPRPGFKAAGYIILLRTHIHTKLECLLSLIGNNHHVVQIYMHVKCMVCTVSKGTQNDFGCCYSKFNFSIKTLPLQVFLLLHCSRSKFQYSYLLFKNSSSAI